MRSTKSYITKSKNRKLASAAAAVSRARATILSARRSSYLGPAPLSNRGFYGTYTQRGRSELKVVENAPSGLTQFVPAGAVVLMNGVAQGSDFTNRIGRKVFFKSILARVAIQPSVNATGAVSSPGDICRVMLVEDIQPNSSGSVPAVTDILTTADPYSGINLNNRDRFKVILDKKIPMNPYVESAAVLTVGAPVVKYIDKFRKCNIETIFSGTGATIGSISTGSLLWVLISQANGANSYNIYSRLRFTDA